MDGNEDDESTITLLRSDYPRRVCLNPFLFLDKINLGKLRRRRPRNLNAVILSVHALPPYNEPDYPVPVHATVAYWVPGLCSLLGILIVNLIDKDRIREEEGFSDSHAAWRARLFLFVGFALMAGGLAGSMVRHSSTVGD